MAGAMMCINVVDSSQRNLLSYPPRNYELEKTFIPLRAESVAGFVGAPSTPSVVSVPSCAVLPSAPSCEMARDGVDGEHSDTTALCDRNVSFQPARNIPSLCWCLPPRTSGQRQTRRPRLLFPVSAKCLHERQPQQQQEEAAAAAAAGGSSSSSRRKQQQQQQEEAAAAAAAGGSNSSRRQQQQQQQQAASSSKQKQAAASRSSSKEQQGAARSSNNRQAVGERQVSSR